MYIVRHATSDLEELLHIFPVVGIVGARQVGKTTLAKKLSQNLDKPALYLDLESQQDLAKLAEPELYFQQHIDKCIILDEIQRIPELFPIMRGLIDKHRIPGRFLILGSASPQLLRESSETLAGRIAYKELTPFNLLEIQPSYTMQQHWFNGGFPESVLASSDRSSRLWLRNFIQTYIERDLPLLGFAPSPTMTRKLLSMLAHFQGGIWNANTFANSLGVTAPTVNRYIDFLVEAYLIYRLQPFYINIKKRLVKSPKMYLRDTGILHELIGIKNFESLQGHISIGASWEGYVIGQIKQRLNDDIEIFYYRTHAGAESDVVLTRGGEPICCIEIKYSNSPKLSRGFHVVIDDLKTKQNFIIIPDGEQYQIHKRIAVCPIYDFLTDCINKL